MREREIKSCILMVAAVLLLLLCPLTAFADESYSVILDPAGGHCDVDNLTVAKGKPYGETDIALPIPDREGYDFAGWYLGDSWITSQTIVAESGPHTLVARWEIKSFPVTFIVDKETIATRTLEYGAAILPPDSPKTGYRIEWKDYPTTMPAKDVTVTGTYVGESYTVSFDGNGAESGAGEARKVTYDKPYGTLPTPKRTGYTLKGWYLNGEKIEPVSAVSVASDHVLVAVWDADTYTVTLDFRGGSCKVPYIEVHYGDAYGSLPTPTRTGYVFGGWLTSNDYQVDHNTKVFIAKDHTLHAAWTKQETTPETDAPGSPEETTEPSKPTEPNNPTEPSKPTEPSNPTVPSKPTEPIKPTDPSRPAEPSKPTDPSRPTEPSKPTIPSKPTEPSKPVETDPPDHSTPSETEGYLDPTIPTAEKQQEIVDAGYVMNGGIKFTWDHSTGCLIYQIEADSSEKTGILETELPHVLTLDGESTYRFYVNLPENIQMILHIPVDLANPDIVMVSDRQDMAAEPVTLLDGHQLTVIISKSGTYSLMQNTNSFPDIKGLWCESAVRFAAARNLLINGEKTDFAPYRPVFWKDVIYALYQIAGKPAVNGDVPNRHIQNGPGYDAICWGAKLGLFRGCGDGFFNPNAKLNKQEICDILWRFAVKNNHGNLTENQLQEITASPEFEQIPVNLRKPVRWGYTMEILDVSQSGAMMKNHLVNRGEFCVILHRFMNAYFA